jgi:hypothetical protein
MTCRHTSERRGLVLVRWLQNRRRTLGTCLRTWRALSPGKSRTSVRGSAALGHGKASLSSLEVGAYCVLSTTHIRATTAALLDLWAGTLATAAPMTVASTVHGWFVATSPVRAAQAEQVPDDLKQVTQFGRAHGVDFVLLDCDAPAVADLQCFSW